jgi:hypothetical protein
MLGINFYYSGRNSAFLWLLGTGGTNAQWLNNSEEGGG